MSIVKFPAAKPTKRFIKICKYNVSLFRVQTESENNWVSTTSVQNYISQENSSSYAVTKSNWNKHKKQGKAILRPKE